MSTIADCKTQVEIIWQESFHHELNNCLHEALRSSALHGVKSTLESALREELTTHLGFNAYERNPKSGKASGAARSGYFKRILSTNYGDIPDLRIPKLRRGNKDREWQILCRYQRCFPHLFDSLLYLYTLGLSIRDLQEALYVLFGSLLSKDAINRVTLNAQKAMLDWQQQPISETPPIIIVDGVWVKILYPTGDTWVDRSGHQRQERRAEEKVILACMGVWPDGSYGLLHYEVASSETEEGWRSFWSSLSERGLDADTVELVVSDGSKGIPSSVKDHFPKAKLQRCVVHKVRGFEPYLLYNELPDTDPETQVKLSKQEAQKQRRYQMSQEAHDIFKAPTPEQAQQSLNTFNEKWKDREPKAIHNFNWGIKRCFQFYHFDASLHPLIRSTNLIERRFRDFRQRADEMGSFPNEQTALTIFHIVMARDQAKHNRYNFAKT